MVGMDSWCPSCGYSVEPGTRFCGGCGTQLAAEDGAPVGQSPTVTLQSPVGPFPGHGAPPALPGPPPPTGSADLLPATPPPPVGSPAAWPPPPAAGQIAPGQPPAPQAPISDTMERMLRPQGLFQNRLPAPVEWQQPYPPAPGAYPPGGQYPPYPQGPQGPQYPPQGSPYPPPPGAPYPQPGQQYPATGTFQQPPPQAWGQAPTGVIPSGAPAPAPAPPPAGPGQAGGYPPGVQYPPGGPYPGPYGNGQYPPGGQFGPGGGPGVQYGPDGMPLPGAAPDGGGLLDKLPFKLPRNILIPAAVAAAAVIVVIVAVTLSAQGGSSSNNPVAGTATAATPTASSSTGTTALTQQQAAASLSGLLKQSGGDRADVSDAVIDVESCGNSITKDVKVFNTAATNRRTLLSKLAQLPGRSDLSPAMISDLTTAWQASTTVDADLAKWAQDQAGHCKKGNTKDANYTATIPFDSKATNAKNAFVQLWNPLAKKDGLPTRQASDL
jgi:hypothetical protein